MFTPDQAPFLAATRVCMFASSPPQSGCTTRPASGDLLTGAVPGRRQTSSLGSHDLSYTKASLSYYLRHEGSRNNRRTHTCCQLVFQYASSQKEAAWGSQAVGFQYAMYCRCHLQGTATSGGGVKVRTQVHESTKQSNCKGEIKTRSCDYKVSLKNTR